MRIVFQIFLRPIRLIRRLEQIILLPTLLITHHFFKRFHKKSSFFLKLFAQFKKIV